MGSFLVVFGAVCLVVVGYQVSCFFGYEASKKDAAPEVTTGCTEC